MKEISRIHLLTGCILFAGLVGFMVACSEDINTEDRFTATDYTIMSYLEYSNDAPNYTEYVSLLYQVPISDQSNSTVAQLLSTRGAYTCFAPNNKAIYDYLDSLYKKGIITEPSWEGFRTEATLDSVRKVIVYNSILDGSNIDMVLEMGDIVSQNDEDEFTLPNLNDRKLYKTHIDQTDSIFINGVSLIDLKNRDVKTLNGRVHEVHAVIAPSNDTMADVLRQYIAENEKGFIVMAKLILACGLDDTLSKTQDDVWEKLYKTGTIKDLPKHSDGMGTGPIPDHRKYGFTIFAPSGSRRWPRRASRRPTIRLRLPTSRTSSFRSSSTPMRARTTTSPTRRISSTSSSPTTSCLSSWHPSDSSSTTTSSATTGRVPKENTAYPSLSTTRQWASAAC